MTNSHTGLGSVRGDKRKTTTPDQTRSDVDRARAHRAADLRGEVARLTRIVDQVNAIHAEWGVTEVEDIDSFALWERVGHALDGGIQ